MNVQIPFPMENKFYFDYLLVPRSDLFRILALHLKPCPVTKCIIYPYFY